MVVLACHLLLYIHVYYVALHWVGYTILEEVYRKAISLLQAVLLQTFFFSAITGTTWSVRMGGSILSPHGV